MPEHSNHRFSATLSTPDLALVRCLWALAAFTQQQRMSCEDPEETNWRASGQKITFGFSSALDRDLFKNEVRRLLPANLVRFDDEQSEDRARRSQG